MLVLSRKCGERIVIGPDIELQVVNIGTSRVRLAIDAPEEIAIYRQELRQQIFGDGGRKTKRGSKPLS